MSVSVKGVSLGVKIDDSDDDIGGTFMKHSLFVGDHVDVLGETLLSYAGRSDGGPTDDEDRGGNAAALEPPVELREELSHLG